MLELLSGNWFSRLLSDFACGALLAIVKIFAPFLNNIFNTIYAMNAALDFSKVSNYISTVAICLAGACFAKKGLEVYVFQTEGDPDADPAEMVTRAIETVAAIYCGNYIVGKAVEYAAILSKELQQKLVYLNLPDSGSTIEKSINTLVENAYDATAVKHHMVSFVLLILIVVMVVALLIFIFHAAKRGAELVLFQLLLPIMAGDLLTTNREKWKAFISELIICIFGYVIQVFAFTVFTYLLAQSTVKASQMVPYLISAIGWLIVVISTPKWLGKFIYSSGVGDGAKGGIRTGSFFAPQLLMKR